MSGVADTGVHSGDAAAGSPPAPGAFALSRQALREALELGEVLSKRSWVRDLLPDRYSDTAGPGGLRPIAP